MRKMYRMKRTRFWGLGTCTFQGTKPLQSSHVRLRFLDCIAWLLCRNKIFEFLTVTVAFAFSYTVTILVIYLARTRCFHRWSWFTIIPRAFENFLFKAETGFLKVSHPFWSFTTIFSIDFVLVRHLNFKFKGTQVWDHSGQCPVQYLESIGPAIEHFDWLILVIGPLTAWVVK